MTQNPSRRRNTIIVLLLLVLAFVALWLGRCSPRKARQPAVAPERPRATESATADAARPSATPAAATEILSPATLQVPGDVSAGAVFSVSWTGPNNPRDYVTVVKHDAPDSHYGPYAETRQGSMLQLTAPIETGPHEVRYVTAQSHTVLARAPLNVLETPASLQAVDEAVLGTTVSVAWTGPNNTKDYITVVSKGTPEGRYGNYTETAKGSPLTLTLPSVAGDAELRYVTGQGARTLARRPIRVVAAEVRLDAPDEVIAGSALNVIWTGPNNPGDYLTLVPKETRDGQYGNYTETRKGSPLSITAPILPGEVELRYMTGQGAHVLARRAVRIVAAQISLEAPSEVAVGSTVMVNWQGPNNPGDYITVVAKTDPDAKYASYAETRKGSPAKIAAPKEPTEGEIRYISGQGSKVLARRPIRIVAP
jgi:hypothetical protein